MSFYIILTVFIIFGDMSDNSENDIHIYNDRHNAAMENGIAATVPQG